MLREITVDGSTGLKLKIYEFGTGGPRILITSGIHGDELTGIYTNLQLIRYLERKDNIHGKIYIIPIVNILGFQASTRRNPIDNIDLNRVFPDGDGSIITKGIIQEVWGIAKTSDYILDLHCAGRYTYQYILSLYNKHQFIKEYTDNISWDVEIMSSGLRGQLFTEATEEGIPAAIIETAGGRGYYDKQSGDTLFHTILQTLHNLGFITLNNVTEKPNRRRYGKLIRVRSNLSGFLEPRVEVGKEIQKGDVIGEVDGETVKSPVSGIVIGLTKDRYIFKQGLVAKVAEKRDQ